jgi:hypothetical protein
MTLPDERVSVNREVIERRFAARLTAYLNDCSEAIPSNAVARLEWSRETALLRSRAARRLSGRFPSRSTRFPSWHSVIQHLATWKYSQCRKYAVLLPLIVVIAGLQFILQTQVTAQITATADIDTALLSDELPPSAYNDSGFSEFLKKPPRIEYSPSAASTGFL